MSGSSSTIRMSTGLGSLSARQVHHERRAGAELALDGDRPAQRANDRLDDVKPETEAAVVPGGDVPLEGLEDAGALLGRDADPVVPDGEERSPVPGRDGHVDGLATAELDRIREEVDDDLLE